MKQELDTKLCSKYPEMFANRYADMKTTAMCWGFEHGDGWFNIIDALCANIQHHINWSIKNNQLDLEFNKMVADMQAGDFTEFNKRSEMWSADYRERMREEFLEKGPRKIKEIVPQVTVEQVKEKFGTLRFYYTGGDDVIRGMVGLAESMTARTCEECGSPGRRHGGGWVTTLCDEHAMERGILDDESEE